MYEFIITDPLPVQEGDVVSVYETTDSPLELYNEKNANIFPPSIPIDDGNTSILQPDGDWPLLSIETGIMSDLWSVWQLKVYCVSYVSES